MIIQNIKRKLKKIYQAGQKECWRIVANRVMMRQFAQKNKMHALQKKAAHNWQDIQQHCSIDFDLFLHQAKKRNLFFLSDHFEQTEKVIYQADEIIGNTWRLFNQRIKFSGSNRWHVDFLLKNKKGYDYTFDNKLYYDDVHLNVGKEFDCIKDVRVVWELNRLQMLPQLGIAFNKTDDAKYTAYFQDIVNDWREHNPYLLGVNWLCPMEVGIRAINLIVAFDYFKNAQIKDEFWQNYICLLYDHMHYLEHRWEYYDGRTNNHYLSDLVGYFYLTCFFGGLDGIQKKQNWVIQEILKEFDKQVQSDGTSYEGSTAYHVLVTELLYLFYVLCDQTDVQLPQYFMQTLSRMFDFIDACKVSDNKLIAVGDNDSGKILWWGLSQKVIDRFKSTIPKNELWHFENFGLSIFKNKIWHISLRHHAYQNKQPSAHFHNDIGNVTLAVKGVPILVDPGSYCYSASSKWRNYFRSAEQHNMPFIIDHELVKIDKDMFSLSLSENIYSSDKDSESLCDSVILYNKLGLTLGRTLIIDNNALLINDSFNTSSSGISDLNVRNKFVFSPEITLKKEGNDWFILYQNKPVCIFKSELEFEQYETWVSDYYGNKALASCLQLEVQLGNRDKQCVRIEVIESATQESS